MENSQEIIDNSDQRNVRFNSSILDAFDLLKSLKDDEKRNGSLKVLTKLQKDNQKDVNYVLKRLIRSLGANTPENRIAYFSTLVLLLRHFTDIQIEHVIDLVKKELHANSSSKSEIGDVALGQILVCGAIFRSGLMSKSSEQSQAEVIQMLLSASKKKSYLSTIAYLILIEFVNTLTEDKFLSVVWANIKKDFEKPLADYSLDSLYFLIVAINKFPKAIKLKKLIGVSEIICEDNINVLCEKIMGGIDLSSVDHPIYEELGKLLADSTHLAMFWSSGIEVQLSKHNRNRELVSLNILTAILKNMKENFDAIPELISNNFFKLFMDWFKGLQTASKVRHKRDIEDDHKIMIKKEKELLNLLVTTLKSNKVTSKVRAQTLKRLLFHPGDINFTEVTGTNAVKSLIADLDKSDIKKLAKMLKSVLLNSSKRFVSDKIERNWYNNERLRAADLISYLVNHDAMKDETEFKLKYMKILMCLGFFKITGDENVAVSGELSGSIKASFYRCFTSRFSNADILVQVLCELCKFINTMLEKNQVREKLEKQYPKENMECWLMLTKVCQNIEINTTKSKTDKVFLILLYQLGLFLFSEPTHVKLARSSIKELKSCYKHYKENAIAGKISKSNDDSTREPEWIEVLIEVLLSLLSCDSFVLRSVVQCVFRLLWENLTPSSIGQIVSVLDPENEANPLILDHDESDSEMKENGTDEADKSDSGTDDESSDDEDDGDENDDDDMKPPEQLRLAVQKALGGAAPDTDTESIDADMIDEEEGKKLDEALAEAFKQFHGGKSKKSKKDRKDQKSLSDFRIRVLDLIDIYLEKDPAMDICLDMIAPLTRSLEYCIQDDQFTELGNRLRKCIKTLTKVKKFSNYDGITDEILSEHLKMIIDKGSRSHFLYQALGDVITHLSMFILHCSQKINKSKTKKKNTSPLLEAFKEAVNNYFLNRTCLLPIIFFHSILQTEWLGTFELVPIIIENVFSSNVRQFRRNEGLELIAGFYRNLKRNNILSEKTIPKLQVIETKMEQTICSALSEKSDFQAKSNFYKILRKLMNTVKMVHESCHVEINIDVEKLMNLISSCSKNNEHMIEVKKNYICKQAKQVSKKKRNFKTLNGNAEIPSKRSRDNHVLSENV